MAYSHKSYCNMIAGFNKGIQETDHRFRQIYSRLRHIHPANIPVTESAFHNII